MKLLAIGFGNYVSAEHIVTIVSPDSAPIKRMIQDVREKGMLIDASFGRSTKSIIVVDSGNVILSSVSTSVLAEKLDKSIAESE